MHSLMFSAIAEVDGVFIKLQHGWKKEKKKRKR